MEPTVSGTLDLRYLSEALARAGAPLNATELVTDSLDGGRMATSVTRMQVRAANGEVRSLVLKVVPFASWREMLGTDSTEARLWLSGATRKLPAGLRCPTVDVARHSSRAEWWILMEDVSSGVLPRGTFDETKASAFMRSIARMHARYWGRDEELEALKLASFDKSATALAALCAHVASGDAASETWLSQFNENFWVPRLMVPALLNAIPSEDADFYIRVCRDHARIAGALGRYPRTLTHGDLRRANIAFVGDDVVLFDWELAACGPAARDVEWYWFLHFWAYPPQDGRVLDREAWLDAYLGTLERECGGNLSRALFDESCELAWLSTFCQVGCCLADPLTDVSPSAVAVARAKRVIAEAFARARRIHDRHVR